MQEKTISYCIKCSAGPHCGGMESCRRSGPPQAGFVFMREKMIQRRTLSNGITLVTEPMEYLSSVSIGIWIRCGSAYEEEKNNGIAHMIEHMLFQGTEKRSAAMLARDTAAIGGNLNAFTEKECTSYYVTVLTEHLEEGMELLGDMVGGSLFEERALEKEKGVVKEEIRMYDDSPEDMVHEMLQKKIWEPDPLGFLISGSIETVDSFTREQITAFWRQYYCGSNMVISMAGNFREEEAEELAERYFGRIPAGSRAVLSGTPVYRQAEYRAERDIDQVHLNLAYECIPEWHEDRYLFALFNTMLGGGEQSRLFQRIREELGLAYSVYSYGSSYEKAGLFQIDATLLPENVPRVMEEVQKLGKAVCRDGFTKEELDCSREQIKTELMIGSESTRNRMNRNGKNVLSVGEILPLQETLGRLDQVTKEQVREFAGRWLIGKMSVSMVGNVGTLGNH